MAASSPISDEVEIGSEVQDLGVAADLDTATSRLFFSDHDAAGAKLSWPAAEAFKSTLTARDLHALCAKYGVPKEYTPLLAGAAPASTDSSGALCVYAAALEAGLRFPLHSFYVKLLRHYGLSPAQLAPNSWTYMAAFVLLCEVAGVDPRVSVFRYFFTIVARKHQGGPSGWHHFQPYQDGTRRRRLFAGHLPSRLAWTTRFFFLKSSPTTPWKCPLKWGKPRRADARRCDLTDTAIQRLQERAGKTGIEIKSFLSGLQHRLPVEALAPLQLKVEARAAAAAADTESAAAVSVSRRKRRAVEAAVPVPPPAPPQIFAATPTPPGVAPEQGASGGEGGGDLAEPPGIFASEALEVLEAANAQRAREIGELKREVQKLAAREYQLLAYVSRLKEEHAADCAHQMELLLVEHAAEVARVKDVAAKEVQAAKKDMVLALYPDLDPALLEP
ncbi:hypothetical protein ACP70R_012075 [Stipagrostis hirtigluma subsp. patula]